MKFNEESSFRLDLRYSKRLKDIEIINTISDSIVKKFEFDTDYFQSNDDNVFNSFGCGTPFDLIEIKKRLYLKKLIEKGSNLLESIEYEFKYYDEVILPHRNSYAQDYWGFFNGEVNNMSLMPSYVITKSDGQFLLNASTPEEYFYAVKINGSKRNINPYYTNSCMLKTIKYPSGGITEFVYENNKTSKNAEIKKNLIDYYTPMYNSIDTNLDPLSVLDNDYYIISKPFVLTSAYGDALGIDYTTFQSNCYQDPTLPNIDCSRFNIKNTDTGQYIFQVNKSLNFDGTVSEISNTSQSIPPGNYALELYIEKNMWNSYPINDKPTLRVNLQWGIYENPEFSFFGGLRIKEIKNFTSEGQLATMKKYSYLNDENKESGDFLNIPIFKERANGRFVRYTGPMCAGGQNALVIEGNCINLSSSPVISLQTVGGNYLGYTDVKEEYYDYLNPSNSYFTNDKFSFFHPFLSFEGAPYNEEWTRGQLQTSKNLVSEVENTYVNENNSLLIENFIQCYDSSKSPIFLLPIECSAYNPNWILQCQRSIGSQSYKLLDNNKSNLLHKVEKSNNVVKTTNYSYSSIINLASEKINTSTNDVLETKYFYPQDQEMNLKPAISELINHNLISSPLVTQTFFNDEKTSEKEVVYQESLLINDILSPKYIYYKKGDDFPGNDMEKKITYDFYDLNGNLTQYTLENGSPVSIIWGYNKSYPIAKIENATNQRIIQALSISNINSLTDADLPDIDALRTSLSNSMITTYTYYPLVGVHTIKDPKGDILTYQYDEFNRLEAVFDKYNNKISENQYHYRTQN